MVGGYAGFSVSGQHLDNIVLYIKNQKQHHAKGSIVQEWEAPDDGSDGCAPPEQEHVAQAS